MAQLSLVQAGGQVGSNRVLQLYETPHISQSMQHVAAPS